MSFLEKPSQPAVFRPPPVLKRSVPPQRAPAPTFQDGRLASRPIAPVAPLGAAPVGLSPGLGPSDNALLVMPLPSAETPMSIPIVKDRPQISDASIRSRMYAREEFMSVRGECCHTPSAILEWILGMYRTDGGVGGLRCPPHLRLLVDELEADRHGALLGGVSRKNARPVRAVHHKVMSILSRLTPQKYDLLKEELFQLPLKQLSDSELREVVKVFFNKSVQEHKFSDLYAHLVADICTMSEADNLLDAATRERLLQTRMRSELLTACQEEFNRPLQLTAKDRVDPITGEPLPEEEITRKRETLKNRLVGNIKFVGELYRYNLVNPRVINSIFHILVFDFDPEAPKAKEEYLFEVFGTLIKTVGNRLSREDPNIVEDVMRVVSMIEKSQVVNRVRFAMMDLSDLHKNGWPLKRQVLTQQELDTAHYEKAVREIETLDRQKAALRPTAQPHSYHNHHGHHNHHHHHAASSSSSNVSTPFSADKYAKRGLASAAATPVGPVRSFPASLSGTPHSVNASSNSNNSGATGATQTAAGRKFAAAGTSLSASSTRGLMGSSGSNPMLTKAGGAGVPSSSSNLATPVSSSVNGGPYGSIPSSPITMNPPNPATRLMALEKANQMILEFNKEPTRSAVLTQLCELERGDCIAVLTSWLRECVLHARHFEGRKNLPLLIYAIVERCEEPNGMILSSSDLLATVLEWLRLDISQNRFGDFPRIYGNWATVVLRAAELSSAAAETKTRTHWLRVLSILSCSTFTLCLREIAINEQREAIYTAISDMNPVAQQVAAICDSIAGRDPQKILNMAATCRFRLLPYIIKADEGDTIRIPHTPSLGPAPTAPIGVGPSNPYHQCFQIQQDDAEMNLFKRVMRGEGYHSTVKSSMEGIPQSKNVTRIVTTMKLTAATLSLLNPPTGEKSIISANDAAQLLREVIQRCPTDLQPIAQAAVVMEMICFYLSNTNKLLGIGGTPLLNSSGAPSSPGKARREDSSVALAATADTFRKWCEAGVVDRASVLHTLQSVAPIAVPSTPGTPPRMSSAMLDALDSSFSLPEPSHRVASPMMGASTSSCPSTPQMGSFSGALRHTSASFKFDMCEMLVRNMNFVSHLRWSNVLHQLQK